MARSKKQSGPCVRESLEDHDVTLMREAPQRLSLPPHLGSGTVIRQAIAAAMAVKNAGHEETADLLLAVSEAINNAIAHGRMESDDHLWMTIEPADTELVVTLDYRGEPFPVGPATLPEPISPGGRGRYLMEQLTDSVTYDFYDHWTRAVLRKQIRGR
jgi:serine/threonine-protein kinase RsbW